MTQPTNLFSVVLPAGQHGGKMLGFFFQISRSVQKSLYEILFPQANRRISQEWLMNCDVQNLLLGWFWSKTFPFIALFRVKGMTEIHRQAQTYWTPQRIHSQYRITPLETHLPAQLEHLTPCCTMFCTVCFILLFFFLSPPVHTRTCWYKPVPGATVQNVIWTFKLTPMLHLQNCCEDTLWFRGSDTLSWPVNAQVSCSNRSVGKRGPGAKGLQRSSFWLQWRDCFPTFVLEGTMLTQK